MSLDLYQNETSQDLSQRGLVKEVPTDAFDNFAYGTGMGIARAGAETGRAASMAVGAFPVIYDKIFGTDHADSYFKFHDEVFQNAVEYWTPQPNEVGVAGEVVGQLVGTLGLVAMSPSLAVAKTQMSTTEDLARKGVETPQAVGVGAIQGLGLGTGIWMPVLGKTLAQRVLIGGVAANVVQGAATRGLSSAALKDTPAEGDFSAFNAKDMTLDVLLGAAFGGIAHLSKSQRAQGEKAWSRIESMAESFKPSDIEAIQTLRQAQHLNVDSVGGTPDGPVDTDAHVQRMKRAIEQLSNDQRVDVSDFPEPKVEPDGRFDEANTRAHELVKDADRIRNEDGIAGSRSPISQFMAAFKMKDGSVISADDGSPHARLLSDKNVNLNDVSDSGYVTKRGKYIDRDSAWSEFEKITKSADTKDIGKKAVDQKVDKTTDTVTSGSKVEDVDPVVSEARRIADASESKFVVGRDVNDEPIHATAKQFLEKADADVKRANEDVSLIKAAAACLMGAS